MVLAVRWRDVQVMWCILGSIINVIVCKVRGTRGVAGDLLAIGYFGG